MPGVTALVLNAERTRMLAVRRADDGRWTPVTGIVDPGEEPGIECTAVRLLDLRALPEITYANGDRAQYLDLCFLCVADDAQEPYPADGENTAAQWFDVAEPPPLNGRFREQLALAVEDRIEARFRR
jgi:ADP-ribose pyrophosphatase YjhB (NUDIX family)